MRILVTGGAGYIGSHTVKALVSAGHQPIVFDNLSTGHREAVLTDWFFEGDLLTPTTIEGCIAQFQPELVIHFAGSCYVGESVQKPALYFRNNIVGTLNLLDAMLSRGVLGIVFSSSCAVYGDPHDLPVQENFPKCPVNPYGRSKHIIEQILGDYHRANGVRSISLRYFNAAGADREGVLGEDHDPETHLIPLVLRAALTGNPVSVYGKNYPTPDGTCIRDYVYVGDLARAHVLAVERLANGTSAEAFNIGCGHGFSVLEVIEAARIVTGREISVQSAPPRPGDVPLLCANINLASEILEWRPQLTQLSDIIRSSWDWLQAHPKGYQSR